MFECLINYNRRVAVLVDENPRYRRLLSIVPSGGVVDVLKVTPGEFRAGGWKKLEVENAAVRYALTFRSSAYFSKTERALRVMKEILMDLKTMDMKALVAEHARLTGRTVKFASKSVAIKAIEKASANKAAPPAAAVEAAASETPAAGDDSNTETQPNTSEAADMGTSKKTTKTKPAKKTAAKKTAPLQPAKPAKKAAKTAATKPAKKAAKTKTNGAAPSRLERAKKVAKMENGSGGMIVKLLKEGKADDDTIISRVLKAFPDRAVNNAQVAWYRSMLLTAGAIKAAK